MEIRNYTNKDRWDDTTIYGGHMSAGKIFKNNGDNTFDYQRYINSAAGEKVLDRIMNELVIYGGDRWDHPDMIQYWKERGVNKVIHNGQDRENAWISYIPENLANTGELYPVFLDYHGGGGTLFESENHGFVELCAEKKFIVICPEDHNTDTQLCADRVGFYLDEAKKLGYPIDPCRVYLTGMSMGGVATLYGSMSNPDIVAAAAAHSSAMALDRDGRFLPITDEMYAEADKMPMFIAIGQCDFNQLPMKEEIVRGLNRWLKMNGCHEVARMSEANMVGILGDRVDEEVRDGLTHTFVRFYDDNGIPLNLVMGIENHPHWVCYSFARIVWDWISHFSRVDGKLYYDGKEVE